MAFVPMVYMQLHGRVWRQKNPYKYAFLINVLTQNSIDAFTYSKLEQKIQAVKQMLEGDVYDAEETQFDVDVEGIKERLINDPAKLAEIKWDDLDKTEQDLLEAYDTDKLNKKLRDLLSQKTPPEKRYKGAAASVAEENTDQRWRQKRDWPGWSSQSKKIKKGSAPPPAATV